MLQNNGQGPGMHRKVGRSMIDLQKLGFEHLVDDVTTKIKKIKEIFYYGLVTFS